VVEVLAFEENACAASVPGESGDFGKRTRAACVVGQQLLEFRREPGIRLGPLVLDGDLIHGGDQRLRDELAAERTEISVPVRGLARQCREEEFAVHRTYAPGTGHARL